MKRIVSVVLVGLMLFGAAPAWADCCGHGKDKGKTCPMKGGKAAGMDKKGKMAGHGEHQCPIVNKILETAGVYLGHAKEIGLSDEQVQTIKTLQLDVEKTATRQEADVQVFILDIQAKLSEPTVDEVAIGMLIDSGFAGVSAAAKASVGQYAKLKAMLSNEQAKKAAEACAKSH